MEGWFGSPYWKMSLDFKGLLLFWLFGEMGFACNRYNSMMYWFPLTELDLITCSWKAFVGNRSRFSFCELPLKSILPPWVPTHGLSTHSLIPYLLKAPGTGWYRRQVSSTLPFSFSLLVVLSAPSEIFTLLPLFQKKPRYVRSTLKFFIFELM